MYIGWAQKFDEENAENWKGGAEGIVLHYSIRLIVCLHAHCFQTGLFASTWPSLFPPAFRVYSKTQLRPVHPSMPIPSNRLLLPRF